MGHRLSLTRSSILAAGLAAGLSIAACGDPTRPVANVPITVNTAQVFALNGTSPSAPSAIALFDGITLRTDARFIFDLAFDLDDSGNVLVIPVRRLAPLGGGHPIGLQIAPAAYAAVDEAPRSGFRYDSTFTVPPGTPLVIESVNPIICDAFSFGPAFYSKLVVTSIDQPSRRISLAFTVNPNCGFRSFLGPIPQF